MSRQELPMQDDSIDLLFLNYGGRFVEAHGGHDHILYGVRVAPPANLMYEVFHVQGVIEPEAGRVFDFDFQGYYKKWDKDKAPEIELATVSHTRKTTSPANGIRPAPCLYPNTLGN